MGGKRRKLFLFKQQVGVTHPHRFRLDPEEVLLGLQQRSHCTAARKKRPGSDRLSMSLPPALSNKRRRINHSGTYSLAAKNEPKLYAQAAPLHFAFTRLVGILICIKDQAL